MTGLAAAPGPQVTAPTLYSVVDDDWRQELRDVITSAQVLLRELELSPADCGFAAAACAQFPLRVPRAFARRMRRGDPNDPLLLQVLARAPELEDVAGFSADPVGELGAANPRPGIISKYRGRVLLLTSGACAVHCRYCFRRHFPYDDNRNSHAGWQRALALGRDDAGITEVILSGGDPLVATDQQLAALVEEIGAIEHVQRLRIHTRLPVVIPARVTAELVAAVSHPRLHTVVVIHCNHAQEIDAAVRAATWRLRDAGFTTLNQSVLLAGVNDDADTLVALSEALFAAGVLPYYLHLLDRVQGAAHFDVPEARARQLLRAVTARLPGYLVPKLVREVAGAEAKVGIALTP